MRVRIVRQLPRTIAEIKRDEKRAETVDILENIAEIFKDERYVHFVYADGTSYGIDKDYLTRYEVIREG